ncbi:MAG: aminoacyl-tRNA hydrolase [Nitrospirae bacterium]|nr:MAG: aminoacyl-tRNA hydrolase [Nitrospirota bacterium]
MWAIVGLGNHGSKYSKTRHNLGFMVADALAGSLDIDLQEKKDYLIGKGSMKGDDVLLVEPLTFMNNSGRAVRDVLKRHNIFPENLIIIHDDLDMETGKLKIKKNGSSGGHKGIESIIQNIGTKEFIRVKIGIGREIGMPAEDYVLRKFKKDELPLIKDAVKRASEAVAAIVSEGASKAMNKFNVK